MSSKVDSIDYLHAKILIVDDQDTNILILERMLSGAGYISVMSTTDSREVYDLHIKYDYDLIILDLNMPGLDGFEVLARLKEIDSEGNLPVLVITAQPENKLSAFQAGARDFISKPFDLSEVLARVHNLLEESLVKKYLVTSKDILENKVRERTADLQESYRETIFTMSRAAEYKDKDLGTHIQRTSHDCRELARILGMDRTFIDQIFLASPMHDIGKIGISDAILLNPKELTKADWMVMEGHTLIGANILGQSKSPYLMMGSVIALNHHERWNGGGYPNGICGETIPLAARIMTICDVYDALRSKRPYKQAFSHKKSMDIIQHGDGRTQPDHFDPVMLAAFIKNNQVFRNIYDELTH